MTVFLQDRAGAPIGPISQRAFEALAAARIIDESTPVSKDGASFLPMGQYPDLKRRTLEVMKALMDEVDPWEGSKPAAPPPAPPAATPTPPPAAAPRPRANSSFEAVSEQTEGSAETASVLRAIFTRAAARSKGQLIIASPDGQLDLRFIDGKIVVFDTNVPYLGLGPYLIFAKVCDAATIAKGTERAASMGGDLGGALVSMGLLPPHTFMEQLPKWVRQAVVGALGWNNFTATFTEIPDMPPPPIPLGLDRFRVFSEILERIDRPILEAWVEKRKAVPLIRSGVEGAALEDLGLDPKTFRVAKSIDGTKTADEIIKAAGTKLDQQLAALRAIYFTTQVGVAVFGEDQRTPDEQRQVKKLEELFLKLEKQNHFEILGVTSKSKDDEVGAKYKEFAKRYHPDMLREGSLPELVDIRSKLFDLYRKCYDNLKDEKKRESYQQIIDKGYDPTMDEQQIVRNVLQAEVEFKKAEALMRMRKYQEALDTLIAAEKLKPDDGEIKIYREYLKVMTDKTPSSPRTQLAIEEIRTLLKANPKLVMGFIFLGRLYKLDEQPGKAAKAWKVVLEMDPKNNEATSELRLSRMREEKDKGKKGIFGR
ncbi:MAG: DnaJ domain-containing protein [Deltaproteobacteria bacterium]|nr:DnaJ domain-containing protein [Deltaproteobacteria bacterium]